MKSSSSRTGSVLASMTFPFRECCEIAIHFVEAAFPEAAIVFEPAVHFLQRSRLELAGPELRVTAARDETGALENFEMTRDGLKRDVERFGKFIDGRFA